MQVKNQNIFFGIGVGIVFCLLFLFPKTSLAQTITSQEILLLVNSERAVQNLQPLTINYQLEKTAWQRANDMIEKNYFSHLSPEGLMPWDFAINENYDYQYFGENLALNWLTAEETVNAWMQSKTHQENILNINFIETGVVVTKKDDNFLIIQLFGKKDAADEQNTIPNQVQTIDLNITPAVTQATTIINDNELETVPYIIPNSILLENNHLSLQLDNNPFTLFPINNQEALQAQKKTLGVNTISQQYTQRNNNINYLHLLIVIGYFPLIISLHLRTVSQNM